MAYVAVRGGRAAIENANALDDIVRSKKRKPARRPKRSRRKRDTARRKKSTRVKETQSPYTANQTTLTGEEIPKPEIDDTLFEALKLWRLERAREQKVPAYVIFPNRTLEEIATYAPTTLEDVETIKGIGPRKLDKYGTSVVELVKEHLDRQ